MTRHTSIAEQVLGITEPDPARPLEMLSQAYAALTGEHREGQALLDERDRLKALILANANAGDKQHQLNLYHSGPEISDEIVMLSGLRLLFVDHSEHPYANVLGTLPQYQEAYEQQVTARQGVESGGRSLLVGSLSAVSSAAFVALSQTVFRADPWIIDPRPSAAKQRHGTFARGNGLRLPRAWDEHFRIVTTNRLTGMLLDAGGNLMQDERLQVGYGQFAQNAFDALQPGGHLLMSELPAGFDFNDLTCDTKANQDLLSRFEDKTRDVLGQAGFTDIGIELGWHPEELDHLYESWTTPRTYEPKRQRPETRMIYARKP